MAVRREAEIPQVHAVRAQPSRPVHGGRAGDQGGQDSQKVVSLLDICPTIMALAELPTPKWCKGRDLSPALRGTGKAPNGGTVSIWWNVQNPNTSPATRYDTIRTALLLSHEPHHGKLT